MRNIVLGLAAALVAAQDCTTWYESAKHGPGFRNVQAYGAKGDGVTDDTAAIVSALTQGRVPSPYSVKDATVVYFPPGNYVISGRLPVYFYTHLVGNFRCMPTITIKAGSFPNGGYVIDSDVDNEGGDHDDEFYRGLMNLRIVNAGGNLGTSLVHWAESQATTVRNVVIEAGDAKYGIFMENGSGELDAVASL